MNIDRHLITDLPDPASAERFISQLAEKHAAVAIKLAKNEALLSDVLTLAAGSTRGGPVDELAEQVIEDVSDALAASRGAGVDPPSPADRRDRQLPSAVFGICRRRMVVLLPPFLYSP